MRRHDLVFVSHSAWERVVRQTAALAVDPLVAGWAERDWPLVVRRRTLDDPIGQVSLGLPLPPQAGKRRLAFCFDQADIRSVMPPPLLDDAAEKAPSAWKPTIAALGALARDHDVAPRTFGSLSWAFLTGLDYLSATSDLDVLFSLPQRGKLLDMTRGLAAIDAAAPMRLDGEFIRSDGAGVNWRELHETDGEVLLKTMDEAVLMHRRDFIGGATI